MLEDPTGDTYSEVASVEIGGAGMNALVDAGFDNVECGIGKTGIGPRAGIGGQDHAPREKR